MAESPGFLGYIKTRELKILAEKRQFLRIAKKLSMAFCFAVALFAAPAFADDPCKNLFDPTKIDAGHAYSASGEYMSNEALSVSDFIPVTPGQKYTISGQNSYFGIITHRHTFWDANHEFVSADYGPNTGSSNPDTVWTVTIPNNVSYLRFNFHNGDQNTFQVEEGETATTHVPYNPLCATCQGIVKNYESATGTVSQNGTPTPTNPIEPTFYHQGDMVLRKVGDVADSYDATTGKITRRIIEQKLTGNEDWVYIQPTGNKYGPHFRLSGISSLIGDGVIWGISDHFQAVTGNYFYLNPETDFKITIEDGSKINVAYFDITSVKDWTDWLKAQAAAGTPVTVYYVLATPVEETPASTTYCADPIKIATTAYNAAAFAPVEAALETAVDTIKDVVANTIVQADAIQNLQDTKQTMPDASGTNGTCPRFRQCLLIETANGTPQWFQIADPVHDLISSLKNNKVNSSGETTQTEYAANGKTDPDSQYYKGYPAMRQLADGETYVYTRQFADANLSGGQYKTLAPQEWAVTWDGNETGTANSFLPGVIYGTSRCTKTKPESTAVGTPGWTTVENSDPVNDSANIQDYKYCYCKMMGVGMDGDITPVKNSNQAPWVYRSTFYSAAHCATSCANGCASYVRDDASFRQSLMNWTVQ